MVKSETCRDAEILVKNRSPRPFGENFRDSKKWKQTLKKRDFETYQKRFRDFEILPKFSETHVFRGTIRHPCYWQRFFLGLHGTYSFTLDKQICKQRSGGSDLLRVTVKPSQGRTPQDSISELIIWKMNPLVVPVTGVKFKASFLHA